MTDLAVPQHFAFTTLTHITKSPNNDVRDIVDMFGKVDPKGSNAHISFQDHIKRSIGHGNHIQGIVAYRYPDTLVNAVAVDWSAAGNGSIVSAYQQGDANFSGAQQTYTHVQLMPGGKELQAGHPGGLQVCGDIIISAMEGVAGQTNACVSLHRIDHVNGYMHPMDRTTVTIAPKSSTVGLVRFQEQYIVAIAREGRFIDIYTLHIGDIYGGAGGFGYCATWDALDHASSRDDWHPNKSWRGAEGGGNLFVSGGKLYFVAFQREKDLSGTDWAALYRLNFVPGQSSRSFTITKCAEQHLVFKGGGGFGPHCRWGASANVSDDGKSMSFVATSRGTVDAARESINTPSLISFCPARPA